jgi:thiazole synthase ThiGH ThiG subunit
VPLNEWSEWTGEASADSVPCFTIELDAVLEKRTREPRLLGDAFRRDVVHAPVGCRLDDLDRTLPNESADEQVRQAQSNAKLARERALRHNRSRLDLRQHPFSMYLPGDHAGTLRACHSQE